ncbi:MAG: hypothetical protein NPINA01_10440 [Nitrospinaceae bacterium]|nr:MAG: hypothetical protein NPINA01_10440 [Nitrospinaceae bacterium]
MAAIKKVPKKKSTKKKGAKKTPVKAKVAQKKAVNKTTAKKKTVTKAATKKTALKKKPVNKATAKKKAIKEYGTKKKAGPTKSTKRKKEGVMAQATSYPGGVNPCIVRPQEPDNRRELEEILRCLCTDQGFRDHVIADPLWLTNRGLTGAQLLVLIAVGEAAFDDTVTPNRGYRHDPRMPGMCCCTCS